MNGTALLNYTLQFPKYLYRFYHLDHQKFCNIDGEGDENDQPETK